MIPIYIRNSNLNNRDLNNNFNNSDLSKSMSMSCHTNETNFNYDCDYNDNDYNNDIESVSKKLNSFFQTDEKQKQLEIYIKNQINYNGMITLNSVDKSEVDSLILIIIETLLSSSPTIRINGEDKPQSVVKSMLMKIDNAIIRYTINKFKQQKHEIKYKKSYLLTCLYNARIEGIYNGINYFNMMGYELPYK